MAAKRVYHWKHGWIPLDHSAAVKKYGSAGAAEHGFSNVSHESLPRKSHIVATHDGTDFHLHDTQTRNTGKLSTAEADKLQASGHSITGVGMNGKVSTHAPAPSHRPMPSEKDTVEVQNELFRKQGLDDNDLDGNPGFASYQKAGYMSMNGLLRDPSYRVADSAVTREKIDMMDDLIDSTNPLSEGITVQRGAGIPPGIAYEVGAVAVEPGYTSASLDPMAANGFASTQPEDGSDPYLFTIKVPAGSHALVTPVDYGEGEVVLPRNSKYRITAVDHQKFEITMELIP